MSRNPYPNAVGMVAAVAALPAVLLSAPFWLVGTLTRWLASTFRLAPPTTDWRELLEYAPEIGWKLRANLDAYGVIEDGAFRLTTDGEGWRGAHSIDDADVLVFGDSFAFGHGVDDDQAYFARMSPIAVKPLGSDGYSMVHSTVWMERLRDRMVGKTILWMIYPGNDLHDNLRPSYGEYRMPFVRQRDGRWEIHSAHVSREPWPIPLAYPDYLDELAQMCTPGYASDRAYAAAGYLLERAAATCAAAGARLVVLAVPRRDRIDPGRVAALRERSPDPDRFDPMRPEKELGRRCLALGVEFVRLADHLSAADYFDRDIHWTPGGHRKVAKLLADLHARPGDVAAVGGDDGSPTRPTSAAGERHGPTSRRRDDAAKATTRS